MLKYKLIIESDNPDDLTAYLAAKHPEATNIVAVPTPTSTPDADTDDDGPTNATPPELDVRGYPWDERIHASSKVINKDGSWRYRRNTAQDVIDAVELELKAITDVKIGDTPVPADAVMTPLETAIEATPVPVPTEQPTPVPVPGAVPTPVIQGDGLDIPPSLQRTAVTYEQAINMISTALSDPEHKLTPERVPELYTKLGVSGPHELPGNQKALDAVQMMLDTLQ